MLELGTMNRNSQSDERQQFKWWLLLIKGNFNEFCLHVVSIYIFDKDCSYGICGHIREVAYLTVGNTMKMPHFLHETCDPRRGVAFGDRDLLYI